MDLRVLKLCFIAPLSLLVSANTGVTLPGPGGGAAAPHAVTGYLCGGCSLPSSPFRAILVA